MIIEIDTQVLANEKLTPTQFFILRLLIEENYIILKEWYESIDNLNIGQELRQLIELEFLASLNEGETIDFSKFVVLTKGYKLLGMDRDWFQELIDIYPVKVIRSDGVKDYLRTDLERCRKIYKRLTGGNISKHERIMNALRFETEARKRDGSMAYMKRLPKWLASEEWRVFHERMLDEQSHGETEEDMGYGNELI